MTVTTEQLYEAVDTIMREDGYAPEPDELNRLFGTRTIQSTSAWRRLMAEGRIRYDVGGRVVTTPSRLTPPRKSP